MAEPVLIVGAGMGGLAAALGLLQRGIPVRLYEDAPQLGEVGAGLSIQPNFRAALAHLGVLEPLGDVVVAANAAARRDYATGEVISWGHTGTAGWIEGGDAVWFLHRADVHSALSDAVHRLDPDCVQLGATLVGLDQDESGVTARFRDGRSAHGPALIGADGVRSVTRAELFGAGSPRFSGVVAWRGLVPAERIPNGLPDPESCRWIGPNSRIICYPVRSRTLINYVAAVGQQTWQVESWSERSDVAELSAHFADGDPTIQTIIDATDAERCFKWALFDRDPLPTWTKGRVTLLGDAAHAMLPFLGQGAGMAVEDGLVLARCMAHDADIPSAFQRYEALRMDRANAVQAASRENGRWPFDQVVSASTQGYGSLGRKRIEDYDAGAVPLD